MRKFLTVFLALLLLSCVILPASAARTPYVRDDALLLTPAELQDLNTRAEALTNRFGIGVYILTVEDFRNYGEETLIFDVLWNYYHDNQLGYGENREGFILMLSMQERDFATFFYGEGTEYTFDSYGQQQLETRFLPQFAEDDWYGGFLGYITGAEEFLEKAAAGEPVRDNPWDLALLFVGISLFLSFVITRILWMRMSNVAPQKDAKAYETPGGLNLTHQEDRFLTRTVVRRKIESSGSGSGSTAHTGGGGSGRSGKF